MRSVSGQHMPTLYYIDAVAWHIHFVDSATRGFTGVTTLNFAIARAPQLT